MNVQRYARIAGCCLWFHSSRADLAKLMCIRKSLCPAMLPPRQQTSRLDFSIPVGLRRVSDESLCDIGLALILYALLKPVNRGKLSLLAGFFRIGRHTSSRRRSFFFLPKFILSEPAC